jgi:MoaA/NifB/PqqE/SkfB family radical SAM enzyme
LELYNFDFSKKIFYHPGKVNQYKEGRRPFPVTLEVDLTNACNHRCSFCFYADNLNRKIVNGKSVPPPKLEVETIKNTVLEASKLGVKGISFSGGGEPLAHPEFFNVLKFTNESDIDCGLITNGSLIFKNVDALASNLQWIRVSMAGGDKESYEAVQGLDHFDRVITNISLLRAASSTLNIGVRILVTPQNLSSLNNFSKIIKDMDLDYLQLVPDQYTDDGGKFWNAIDTQETFNNVGKALKGNKTRLLTTTFLETQTDLNYPKTCYAHFFQTVITAEGDLIFCKNARGVNKYILGNINQNTLAEIWNSQKTLDIEKDIKPSNCGLFCRCMALNNSMESIMNPPSDMSPSFVT